MNGPKGIQTICTMGIGINMIIIPKLIKTPLTIFGDPGLALIFTDLHLYRSYFPA